jgi:biotin transporter BioY
MNLSLDNKVLSEVIAPQEGTLLLAKKAALVVAGIAFLAIAAKIKVPMWPVPVTMGTFAVLTMGAAYGARLGLMTILGYMIIGALGFDVFAGSSAEKFGMTYMMGGTGGYLVGYVLAVLMNIGARRVGSFGSKNGWCNASWERVDLYPGFDLAWYAVRLGQANFAVGPDAIFDW